MQTNRFLTCLAGLWCLAALVGCEGSSSSTPAAGTGTVTTKRPNSSADPKAPAPLLENWAKPAFAIVFTGEQHGYLEPCGCSETQSGGLKRRADLIHKMEQREWPVVGFDLGGTVARSGRQQQIKFEALVEALKQINYQAVGVGADEIRLGPDYLFSQIVNGLNNPEGLALVCANVVLLDLAEGSPLKHKIVTIGDKRVGVTAVLGESHRDTLQVNDPALLRLDSAEAVLPEVVREMQAAKPDLMVLLSFSNDEEVKRQIEAAPGFDIVVSAGGPEDPDNKPQQIGKTMLLHVGRKGKYAGVVGFYPDNAQEKLRYELVDLDNRRFQDDPAMHEVMRQYQMRIAEEQLVRSEAAFSHPSGSTFVGAEKCGECHKKAFAKWKNPGDMPYHHSHAYESLIHGRKGQEANWISRINDPECLACHVTGWDPENFSRYDSGFLSMEDTPQLAAQQCENCHGPGSKHVEFEELFKNDRSQVSEQDLIAQRKALHKSIETAERTVCNKCHDLDNSPKFAFKEYWEKIKHPWRD